MNKTTALTISDYFLAIGNQFFNLDENDWNFAQDDLNYEAIERTGFNGYVLKFEEKADEYSNSFKLFLIGVFNWLKTIILKKNEVSVRREEQITSINRHAVNTQTAINNKVRDRLLKVLNEDIDKWNMQTYRCKADNNRRLAKNQFKRDLQKPGLERYSSSRNTIFHKILKGISLSRKL